MCALKRNICFIITIGIFLISGCSGSLHHASKIGDMEELKAEFDIDGDVNDKNFTGSTPLHIAALYKNLNIVKFLIARHADVNIKNSFLDFPLHNAAKGGSLEIFKIIYVRSTVKNSRNNHGNTPFIIAAQEGHGKIVKFLISKNVEINQKNNYQESARFLASKNGHTDVVEIINNAHLYREKVAVKDKNPPEIIITTPKNTTRGLRIKNRESQILVQGRAVDKDGISAVFINDVKATLNNRGEFFSNVKLGSGINEIIIVAKDIFLNESFKIIRIEKKKNSKIYSDFSKPGKYHALIIGNNNYSHLPKLKTARNDAISINKILKSRYNFKTTLLLDAGKVEISRSLNKLRRELGENDNLLIYYAGHGYFDKTVKKAYWWPIDAEADDDTNWMIADTITANIQRIASKHILIIADSCYSGTLTRAAEANMKSGKKRNSFLNEMQKRKSRTLLASGGNEPVSDEGYGNHSIFAAALLKSLKNVSGPIFTAEELFYKYIKESVAGSSAQVPQYSIIRNSGHNGGDFVFRKRK